MKKATKAFVLTAPLLVVTALIAGAALAQGTGKNDGEGWVPVKHMTFTQDDIEGGTLGPEGERIEAALRTTHPSLIELRRGFEAEIVKTMEDM